MWARLTAAVFLFVTLIISAPVHAMAPEIINKFDAHIVIQKNSTISVVESITYDFGDTQKHGIFRDIPLTSAQGPNISITVRSVRDELGNSYTYTTSISNSVYHVKIGDPDILLSGVKTYVITYDVRGGMRAFEDHDELYWNVTGDKWLVGIQSATASVILPDAAITNPQTGCFTGYAGSTATNCIGRNLQGSVMFATNQSLGPGQGLTIVVGFPRGYVTIPAYTESSSTSSDFGFFGGFFLAVFVFIVVIVSYLVRLISSKKKPKPVIPRELRGKSIITEYNPPNKLLPIEVGTILDRRVDITDISSVIMDLAVRGYLKIRYVTIPVKFWKDKKDFELVRLKDGLDLIHPGDKLIFGFLFSGRDSVLVSKLANQKTAFQAVIKSIIKGTEDKLDSDGYFDESAKHRTEKLGKIVFAGTIAMFVSYFILKIVRGNIFGVILFVVSAVGTTITGGYMGMLKNKLSPQGFTTLEKILGFREFLDLTEKDKLALLNAPALEPETFEKFLPYAMVLGVEEQWAKKFEGIYAHTPAWFEDTTSSTAFSTVWLTHNLSTFGTSFNNVYALTAPRSSSGFSGGSSGGGGGGGGGGSW